MLRAICFAPGNYWLKDSKDRYERKHHSNRRFAFRPYSFSEGAGVLPARDSWSQAESRVQRRWTRLGEDPMNHLSDSQLNEYLDGSLTAGPRHTAASHLKLCDSCRTRLAEFQLVFDQLAQLPEARLAHDLTPRVLARLPQENRLWTPILAFQFVLAAGMLLWLSSEAVGLIRLPVISMSVLSEIAGFRLPQLDSSAVNRLFGALNLQPLTINFLFTIPKFQFHTTYLIDTAFHMTLPHLQYWINQLPAWWNPPSDLPLSLIALPVLLLWIFGNAVLLRDRSEAKK
jgi:hypothetical protein